MLAGPHRKESETDKQPEENKSDQSLTFNDPLWPMQWELVGVFMCKCMCSSVCLYVFIGLIWKPHPDFSHLHVEGCSSDRHKSGRLSCVTGE